MAHNYVAVLLAVDVRVVVAVSLVAFELELSKREELERLSVSRLVLESERPDLCGIRAVYENSCRRDHAVALARDDRVAETVGTAIVLYVGLAGIPTGVEGLAGVHILDIEITVTVADNRASALTLSVDIGLRANAVSADTAAEIVDTAENSCVPDVVEKRSGGIC